MEKKSSKPRQTVLYLRGSGSVQEALFPFFQKLRVSIHGPPGSWESCGSDLQRNGEIKAETEVRDRGGGRRGVGSRVRGVCPC